VPRSASGRATVLEAWQELPPPLQQRAIVISQDLGVEEYFNAMVGQVPEQLAGTAAFEPSPLVRSSVRPAPTAGTGGNACAGFLRWPPSSASVVRSASA
jgi:hypothetical protein